MYQMCKTCNFIKNIFKAAKSDEHMNYSPVLMMLSRMEKQGRIVLYAGDCPPDSAVDILESDIQYTVCHYFQCNACGQYIFIGACIRGTPGFKILKNLDGENIGNLIWGNVGSLYEHS